MRRIIEIVFLVVCGLAIIILSGLQADDYEDHSASDITVERMILNFKYDILLDSFNVIYDTVERNEFLADIFSEYNIDYKYTIELNNIDRDIFNTRKFRQGKPFAVLCSKDTSQNPDYFVYEETPVNYVVFHFGDSLKVRRGKNKVNIKLRDVSGTIKTSLWKAFTTKGKDPELANKLSDIYAWVIDFFGIQEGDQFKVIYEERYVGDQYIGLGKIYASVLTHYNKDYYAFYFEQDSIGDYFDENGGSLRRTFLKAPLRYSRISSGYSLNRFHPILKIYRPHRGIDYAAPYGTPVYAVGDGVVTERRYTSQGGRTVKIKHNGTYSTRYLHLASYGKGIYVGANIKQGDVVGYVGQSGLATGPHLDFRFYKNGYAVNPLKIKSPPAKPVDSAYLDKYSILAERMMKQLNEVQ